MSEETFKLPLGVFPYQSDAGRIICDITDADGTIICTMFDNGESSQTRHERANQIADAINTTADLREKLRVAEVILRRCTDAWCGGAEDDGLMDDIQTCGNQIRRLLSPAGESEVIEF